MRPNYLREKLRSGKPTVSTNVMIKSADVIEILGHAGTFDYVEYQAEYVPWDLDWLDHFARTVALFPGMGAMIKFDQEPRTFLAAKAIGAGIDGICFADIKSVENAKECITAARSDTPKGKGRLGYGDRRVADYFLAGLENYVKALDETVITFMIEKREAFANLDAILSVEGLDMVQFGPGDYSLSVGKPGQWDAQELKDGMDRMIKTALKYKVHPRVAIGAPDDAKKYLDMGVRHFILGTDLATLWRFWKDEGGNLKGILEGR